MADTTSRGFVVQARYQIRSDVPVIQLFGRLEDGASFLVEDDRERPYFYVAAEAADEVADRALLAVEPSPLLDLDGAPVARVVMRLPGDVPPLRDRLIARGVRVFEADVRFPYRYLMSRGIRGNLTIAGEAQERAGLRLWKNPQLEATSDHRPSLRTLSIDVETSADAKCLFSIALVGCGIEEVLLVIAREVKGARCFPDEASCLAAFFSRMAQLDPDLLLGWSLVDFDLRVLAARAEALSVKEHFGRVPGRIRIQRDPGFTRQSRGDIPGRIALDGLPVVRAAMRLPDYRLDTVAKHVLGRGKLIDSEVPDKAGEILRQYREDPEALAAYNLEDARLVPEILEKEGLLDLCVERSLLSGMPLDRVGASIASFDQLYLPELNRRGRVAPCVDASRKASGLSGGAVLDGKPGLFDRVGLFDFKSLYPSLIRTFHLDPLAHALGRSDPEALRAPNGATFAGREAILPELIKRFMERREAAKARGDRHADQAIKIMMNSLYGVLGASSCRFFEPAIANAITGFGQQILGWTCDSFEDRGAPVLYGDTDSVFVALGDAEPNQLRESVEAQISERIGSTYGVPSLLTLELERVFARFFLPRTRRSTKGSKKRYAGWENETLYIAGLESVRRDWPELGKRLQRGLLERLFRDEPLLPFAKEVVAALRAGELDSELIYSKRLRKREAEYTKTTPPHVQAARKAGRSSGVIHYVMTVEGPEVTNPGQVAPPGIDHSHYVERVMRPIADAILPEVGEDFGAVLGEPSQLSLL